MSVIDDQTFIIYDHTVLKREEDDLKDAIVYFYPTSVPINTQCGICGQLMGMVELFKDLMGSPPSLFKLQTTKFSVKHLGQYSLALAASLSCPDSILSAQLDQLYRLFRFYHKSLPTFYKRADSCDVQNDVWSGHVQFIRHYGHSVSASFMSLPYKDTPQVRDKLQGKGQMIHLQAKHLLQHCEQHFPVFSGCVFYRNSVLTTQLCTDLTSRLLLIRPQQFSSQKRDGPCHPDGVHILPVYLTLEEYAAVSQDSTYTPPSSHSSETTPGQQNTASATCSNSEEETLGSPQDNSKSEDLKTDNRHEETDPINTELSSETGIEDRNTQDLNIIKSSSTSVTASSSSSSAAQSSAEDMGGQAPTTLMMRQPLVMTSDPVQIMKNIKAVAARGSEAFSKTPVGKRVAGPQSTAQKEESVNQDEVQEEVLKEGITSNNGENDNSGSNEDSSKVSIEDFQDIQNKSMNVEVSGTERFMNSKSQIQDNTGGLCSQEVSGEMSVSTQSLTKQKTDGKEGRDSSETKIQSEEYSSQAAGNSEMCGDSNNIDGKAQETGESDLYRGQSKGLNSGVTEVLPTDNKGIIERAENSLKIERTLNKEIENSLTVESKSQKDTSSMKIIGGTSQHQSQGKIEEDLKLKEQNLTGNQVESSQEHHSVTGTPNQVQATSSGLVSLELYVQNNSEMVILLLMTKGSKKNPSLISSMWKTILPQLADLEAKLQMCPKPKQAPQEALSNYQYVQYNSMKKSLSGRISLAEDVMNPGAADQNQFCQNAVFIHDTNNQNSRLKELVMRKACSIVYGHRVGAEESFFQRNMAAKSTGAPSEKDSSMQINRKIREKLYKDQHISLL